MEKKKFNATLKLNKTNIASLNTKQMSEALGGNAPNTTNGTYYTKVIRNGHCVQPTPAEGCVQHTVETICFVRTVQAGCSRDCH